MLTLISPNYVAYFPKDLFSAVIVSVITKFYIKHEMVMPDILTGVLKLLSGVLLYCFRINMHALIL